MRRLTALHAEADEIAARVGLADMLDTPVRQISYGSQRQLEVALALACRPRVLLLDEPTSGMSPEETARMHELIKRDAAQLTVIVIEHDMDIVLDFADRIIVLDYGRVLEQGTPAEIRNSQVVRERYLGDLRRRRSGRGARAMSDALLASRRHPHLSRRFSHHPGRVARVPAGKVVALLGRNGAGKTTTLRSIMRMVAPGAAG